MATLTITPNNHLIASGVYGHFRAMYEDGNVRTDVTDKVIWSTEDAPHLKVVWNGATMNATWSNAPPSTVFLPASISAKYDPPGCPQPVEAQARLFICPPGTDVNKVLLVHDENKRLHMIDRSGDEWKVAELPAVPDSVASDLEKDVPIASVSPSRTENVMASYHLVNLASLKNP